MLLLSLPNELLIQIAEELTPKPLYHFLLASRFLSILLTPLLHNLAASPLLTLPNEVILQIARCLPLKPLSRFLRTSPFHKRLLTPLLHDLVSGSGAKSSLLWAARTGYEPLVKILLEKGVSVNFRDYVTGETALHIATDRGYEGIVETLLGSKELDINLQDFKFKTALHCAVGGNSNKLVALLLDHGIDANAKNFNGDTVFHIAARKIWGYDTCKIILQRSVDMEVKNLEGKTAILEAAGPEVLELLCENGADTDAQDMKGMTALHHAVSRGDKLMVEVLLKNGANTEMRERDYKKTALHMAALNGNKEIVEMLLEKGAIVDGKDGNGVTPLSKAVIARSAAVVEILLEKGAGLDVQDYFGISPFQRAIDLSCNAKVIGLMQAHKRLGIKTNLGPHGRLAEDRELKGRSPERDQGNKHFRAQKSPIRSAVLQVARLLGVSEKETNKATNTPRE
ncbi:Glycerophosphocholine phosphodiesterase [Maublancomyces gigas]|uniref:Glycerophosphocholine phosphodiesterase n=1 Tax=Discina gigas TaxID=1032678 RepID=A0ABR3GVE5_9PEZI